MQAEVFVLRGSARSAAVLGGGGCGGGGGADRGVDIVSVVQPLLAGHSSGTDGNNVVVIVHH